MLCTYVGVIMCVMRFFFFFFFLCVQKSDVSHYLAQTRPFKKSPDLI